MRLARMYQFARPRASPSRRQPRRDHRHGLRLRASRWSPTRAAWSPITNVLAILLIKVAQENGAYCSGRCGAWRYTKKGNKVGVRRLCYERRLEGRARRRGGLALALDRAGGGGGLVLRGTRRG